VSETEPTKGLLVTLEGGEGAGKSHQLQALATQVERAGRSVTCTREPGGTTLGERLRNVLLDVSEGSVALDPMAETLLFVAARAELVSSVLSPALDRGDVIVCDRFADSTLAYQGFGRGIELPLLEQLNTAATRGLRPHLTILLDLPAEEGLQRNAGEEKHDRFEVEDISFHKRVRHGYLALAAREPDRWLIVDARQPPGAVTEAIWARLKPLL
jgi:dTMP kinase